MNTNETIEIVDLEPNCEVKGGPGAANLVSFDTTTPGTSSGASRPGSSTGNFTLTFNGASTVGL